MDRNEMSFLSRLLIVVILVLSIAPAADAKQTQITIDSSSAEGSYPSGITFHVSASAGSPIVKAELFYSRAGEETLYLESTPVEPATHIDQTLKLDLFNNFLPPGIEITYRWRVTDESGATFDSDPQQIDWVDQRFDWKSLSTDGLSIYYYASNEQFAQSILDTAQSTIEGLRANFGLVPTKEIRLWVYDTAKDFEGAQVPNSGEWVRGSAFPAWGLILAVLPNGEDSEVLRVVPHEITHQVLHQAMQNPFNSPPLWYDEGFAVYQQQTGTGHMPGLVAEAAAEGRLLSLRSLTGEYPYDTSDVSLAYAEGFDVVRFIVERWGTEGIDAIVKAYREGVTHDQAFSSALGVTVDELDRMWQESIPEPDDDGVAVGMLGDGGGGSVGALIVSSASILLVLAGFVSFVFMMRRSRSSRTLADEVETDAYRGWNPRERLG
jgi:hypothetical protein